MFAEVRGGFVEDVYYATLEDENKEQLLKSKNVLVQKLEEQGMKILEDKTDELVKSVDLLKECNPESDIKYVAYIKYALANCDSCQ